MCYGRRMSHITSHGAATWAPLIEPGRFEEHDHVVPYVLVVTDDTPHVLGPFSDGEAQEQAAQIEAQQATVFLLNVGNRVIIDAFDEEDQPDICEPEVDTGRHAIVRTR